MTQETKAAIQKEAEELYPDFYEPNDETMDTITVRMLSRMAYITGRTKSIEEIESLKRRLASYKRKEAAREREIERLKAEINRLTMDNMTHEYNQAEAEKYAPEFERQIREDERCKMIDENEKLVRLLQEQFFKGLDWDNEDNQQSWQQFCKENNL